MIMAKIRVVDIKDTKGVLFCERKIGYSKVFEVAYLVT